MPHYANRHERTHTPSVVHPCINRSQTEARDLIHLLPNHSASQLYNSDSMYTRKNQGTRTVFPGQDAQIPSRTPLVEAPHHRNSTRSNREATQHSQDGKTETFETQYREWLTEAPEELHRCRTWLARALQCERSSPLNRKLYRICSVLYSMYGVKTAVVLKKMCSRNDCPSG